MKLPKILGTEQAGLRHPIVVLIGGLIVATLLAPLFGLPITVVTQMAVYALYGMGVDLVLAYSGLVAFGAAVFFGTASYSVALFMLHIWPNEIAALIFAVAIAVVEGTLIGALALRRRSLYFALLTLAFTQLSFEVAYKWTGLTGGENGIQDVPRVLFPSALALHAFTIATVAGGFYWVWRIGHSPFGRVLQGMRDNETRMRFLGYDTYRYRLVAFVAMAALLAWAGGLLTLLLQGAYASNLGYQHAGDALLMVLLGGMHQFLGPLWGAMAFILLTNKLSEFIEQWWLIFAPIIIVFALLAPEGMVGLSQFLTKRRRWTIVRHGIPPRPDKIEPFVAAGAADAVDGVPVLTVRGLSKAFGSLVVADKIDLDFHPRVLHSVIGPNGAGKTTFFNLITGLLHVDGGSIKLGDVELSNLPIHKRIRLGIARSFQIISVFPNLTAFETVRVAVQAQHPLRARMWRDAYAIPEINARAWSLMDAVGLADRAGEQCINLSHGEQRLLEIAVTLATDARLLLLDEPLAGLAEADRITVAALIKKLAVTHAVLLIEHDIDRVLAISDRISVFHQGHVIADGPPAQVAVDPGVIEAYIGTKDEGIQQERIRHAGAIAGATPILEIENLHAGYAGSLILDGLSLKVHANEVVALLGRNGVGKTTTQRAIMGAVQVKSGRILLDGHDITKLPSHTIAQRGVAIVPEGRRLFSNLSVTENLRIAARPGGASLQEVWDLFPRLASHQHSKAETLSGGERQMCAIARALMAPARIILLDEPFEGLAPAIVAEVLEAVRRLSQRVSLLIVEHKAELVLPFSDRAYILVNGQIAYEGTADELAADLPLQARLLGVGYDNDEEGGGLEPGPMIHAG